MDTKIAALSGLYFLDEKQSGISAVAAGRHLRAILSSFSEEILSEDEHDQLIASLEQEKYISKENDVIRITREGAALVHAVSERILGQTALDRLRRMMEDYTREGSAYIQKVNEQLKSLQEMKGNKVKEVDKASIRTVGLIVEMQHKYSNLLVHSFELDPQVMRNESALDSEINYSARKFTESTGYPIIHHRNGNILQITSLANMPSFKIFVQELHPFDTKSVERKDVHGWNLLLASLFMENSLWELGYIRSHWPGRTFIQYRDVRDVQTNIGCLKECESFNLDFIELRNDEVFVWIESFVSPTKRILDFLQENAINTSDRQKVLDCLNGLKLRTIPSGGEVELTNVITELDLTTEKVPATNRTFANYWQETYGIQLSQRVQPILVVQSHNRDFHYPAEMLYIDRLSIEERLGKSQVRKPRTESPKERFEKLQSLFSSIKNLRCNNLKQYLEINLRKYAPTVEELCKLGAFEGAIRIHPPMLEFHAGSVSLDPLDIFDANYGPVCGRKNISVTHLILPSDISDTDSETFIKELGRAFSRCGFGKIQKAADMKTERYVINEGQQEIERKARNLGKVKGDGNIAIAVIPDNNNEYYYSLKRLMPLRTGTPLQSVTLSTFQDILFGRFPGFKYLCLKILIKTLNEGQAIWTLSNAAGLRPEKTLFVGIGFSRYPREKKVSKCATVLHDARGDRVSWRVFSAPQERTITVAWFNTLLYRIRDVIEKEKPSRLVLYRTGMMYPEERVAVENSLEGCQWLKSIRVSFVSAMDARNSRLYLYYKNQDRYQNIPAGYAIVMNDEEALLSSSNYDDRELRQGTVVPIHLRLEIGNENIIELLKEYHDLTYLNWQAPTTTAKHPLVIIIAERFAELTREGVSAENMFYLDL